jgi:hypothetical protein
MVVAVAEAVVAALQIHMPTKTIANVLAVRDEGSHSGQLQPPAYTSELAKPWKQHSGSEGFGRTALASFK